MKRRTFKEIAFAESMFGGWHGHPWAPEVYLWPWTIVVADSKNKRFKSFHCLEPGPIVAITIGDRPVMLWYAHTDEGIPAALAQAVQEIRENVLLLARRLGMVVR
jgi:hypothetical protein